MRPSSQEISELFVAWGNGDREALDQLMPLVYDELRRIAHRYLDANALATRSRPPRWSTTFWDDSPSALAVD